jgi:hypothetical protein
LGAGEPKIERSGATGLLQVDNAVPEIFVDDRADSRDKRAGSCRSSGKSGRERDEKARVMMAGVQMIS